MTIPTHIWSARKRILRVLPRHAIVRLANVRYAWFYSRRTLEEHVIKFWPVAGVFDAFADLMEEAHYDSDSDQNHDFEPN